MVTLRDLLQPVSPEVFWTEYFGKKPLHLSRRPHASHDIFGLDALERYLYIAEPQRRRRARLVRGQDAELDCSLMSSDDIARAMARGYTLSLQGLADHWPPAGRYVAELADELGCRITTNCYVSPAGAEGLETHADAYDVLVLQIAGTKRWELFEQTTVDPISPAYLSRRHLFPTDEELLAGHEPPSGNPRWTTPVDELLLEPGDTLYLPRGVPHRALAVGSTSIHLTIGILAPVVADLVAAALTRAAVRSAPLRASIDLPAGEDLHGAFTHALDLVREAVDEGELRDAARYFADGARGSRRPCPGRYFETLLALDELTLDDRLRRRVGARCEVEHDGSGVVLSFASTRLRAGPDHAEAFSQLASLREFVVRDLRARDPLHLARRLIREGLLEHASPPRRDEHDRDHPSSDV